MVASLRQKQAGGAALPCPPGGKMNIVILGNFRQAGFPGL
jgi:hypothetical protein